MSGSVMLFQELSQILAEARVSASQKDHILASIRERSIPLEEKIHEDPEDLPKETEKLWIMHDGEKPLEVEHLSDPARILEDTQGNVEDLHDALDVAHESSNQEYMDPIESWFQMTVMTALGTIEQLIENRNLDVLHEEKGTEAYKTSVNDVKQELARRKLSEIHYLKSMLEKLQEQNQIDKKRIELLRSARDDVSHADSALRKLRDYNAPLKEICRSMNAHFGS